MSEKFVINVDICRGEGGYYIATSRDLRGLIVCTRKFLALAKEIPDCIIALLQKEFQADFSVDELLSNDDADISRVVFEATPRLAA